MNFAGEIGNAEGIVPFGVHPEWKTPAFFTWVKKAEEFFTLDVPISYRSICRPLMLRLPQKKSVRSRFKRDQGSDFFCVKPQHYPRVSWTTNTSTAKIHFLSLEIDPELVKWLIRLKKWISREKSATQKGLFPSVYIQSEKLLPSSLEWRRQRSFSLWMCRFLIEVFVVH